MTNVDFYEALAAEDPKDPKAAETRGIEWRRGGTKIAKAVRVCLCAMGCVALLVVACNEAGLVPVGTRVRAALTTCGTRYSVGDGLAPQYLPDYGWDALHDCYGSLVAATSVILGETIALLSYSAILAIAKVAGGSVVLLSYLVKPTIKFAVRWVYYAVTVAGGAAAIVLVWWIRSWWLERALGSVEVPKPAEPVFKIGVLSKGKEGLLCTTSEGVRVVIDEASFNSLVEVKTNETTNEALVAGHPFYPTALPQSVVRFVSEAGLTLGLGVRVGDWLVTAMHVIALPQVRIAGPVKMLELAKIRPRRRPITSDIADFFAAELPVEVWSVLGVRAAKAGLHSTAMPVTIYGMWDNKPVFSNGIVLKQTRKYQIEHSCSTMESFSGSPVFNMATKAVVGIHLGHTPNRFAKMKPFLLFASRVESPWQPNDADIYSRSEQALSVQSRDSLASLDDADRLADDWGAGELDENRHLFHLSNDDDDDYKSLEAYGVDARGREMFPDRYQEETIPAESLLDKVPPPAMSVGTPFQLLNFKEERLEVSSQLCQIGVVDAIRGAVAPPKKGPTDDLLEKFPQMKGFSWPPRSASAEQASLAYHVQFVPAKFDEALLSELKMLVRGAVQQMKTQPLNISYDVSRARFDHLLKTVVLDASPGYPYSKMGALNSDLLAVPSVVDLLYNIWAGRMELMASRELSTSEFVPPLELLQQGWVDLVRVFIKNEPHSVDKMTDARYRLILSISLIDQLIERALYTEAHELEIRNWRVIPFAIGLSATDEDLKYFAEKVKEGYKGNDCRAFDWTQSESWGELYNIFNASLYAFEIKMLRIAHNREITSNSQLLGLSDGRVMQAPRGIHKTGRFETGRRNCFVRLMVHLYCTYKATRFVVTVKCSIEMGDDCLEKLWKQLPPKKGEVALTKEEQYTQWARILGIRIKCWNTEFCGFEYSQEGLGFRNTDASFWKTAFRLLSGTPTQAQIESVRFACRYHERLDCVIAEASARLGKEGGNPL